MSREDFSRDWVPFRDPILSAYPELTDEDLSGADGSTVLLSKVIAHKQGIPAEEAQQRLHEFLSGPLPADAYAAPVHDNASIRDSGDYIAEGEDALSDDARFGDDAKTENPVGRDR